MLSLGPKETSARLRRQDPNVQLGYRKERVTESGSWPKDINVPHERSARNDAGGGQLQDPFKRLLRQRSDRKAGERRPKHAPNQ